MRKVFFVDAYALIYRAYYAFINRPMRNSEGLNTSAIFGFTKFIKELIKKENPEFLGVAFDPKGGSFRTELFVEYKANRQKTPEDITLSVPYIKQIMEAMRIPVLEIAGYEADDVIGTLSVKAAHEDFEVYMVTPDKDYGQLIKPTVYMYKPRTGEGFEKIGCDRIEEVYGISDPKYIIDILALWGDASDNIPGVPGIGEKTATKLVCEFGTVENLLENLDKIPAKQREKIEENREQLLLSKQLATIHLDVPVDFVPDELRMEEPDKEKLGAIYKELGFRSFLQELGGTTASPTASATTPRQQDLFGNVMSTGNEQPQPVQGGLFDIPISPSIKNTTHDYAVLTDIEDIKTAASEVSGKEEFAFAVEVSQPNIIDASVVGISLAAEQGKGWYIPVNDGNIKDVINIVKPLFENERTGKVGYDVKSGIMALSLAGIEVKGMLYDVMIMHYLLNPETRHSLDFIARDYLDYSVIAFEEVVGKGVKQTTIDKVPIETAADYSCEVADTALRLKNVLWSQLEKEELVRVYKDIDEPLIRVLADMELTGVKVDCDVLQASAEELNAELAGLGETIREMVGEPNLNISSAKQLGEVLFGKMKIDPQPKLTKTKQYRTDEEYLLSLGDRHPVIGLILDYRGLRKLLSTYIEALPALVDKRTGRIHTTYNQAITATGRLSSTNPNLQNIPIRDDRGREIRKAFVTSDSEHVLLAADYSQIELRLMAHLSGDKNMIEAFSNKEDIHAATAARIYNIPEKEVTREHRRRAKTANFGIIYGISAFGLSQRLQIPRNEAKEIIEGYFNSYPGVKKYMEDIVLQAREDGYVKTLFGRKRMLPDIKSGNAVVRGLAERNAVNAPIQGGAADIMKLAMTAIHNELINRNLKSKLILQVHDELVLDVPKEEQGEVCGIVVDCMENAAKLSVELVADCGTGNNWLEAH